MNLAVVIVTYESAAHIGTTLRALGEQLRDGDELVVVDNASRDGTATAVLEAAPAAQLLAQTRNLGFAAGCNVGARAADAPLLLFLNPDAVPEPGCLDALREAAATQPDWGTWQPLVTMNDGGAINTSGGVTHFLGVGWAGHCGEPVDLAPRNPTEVSFASGAALCVRREAWEALDGFEARYFMYGEDLDLGLRTWLSGYGVGVAPAARVHHDYEFVKGERKWFLLERNRWWTVLSDYPAGLLLALLPALLVAELVLLAVAARGGWLRAKLRAQATVARELPQILARRRRVQARRAIGAAAFARRLSASLDNPYLGRASQTAPVMLLQQAYWRAVSIVLALGGRGTRAP